MMLPRAICWCLLSMLVVRAQDASPSPAPAEAKSVVDKLTQAQMQEIFRLLQQRYIKPESLSDDELNRAAVQGLLDRLGLGVALVEKGQAEAATSAAASFFAEDLTPATAYLRPGTLKLEEVPKLDVALEKFAASPVQTLIFDLRSPAADGDFLAAAQILSRFLPDGQLLFHLQRPGEEKPRPFSSKGKPRWTRNLLLLVDSESSNVAEVVAAVLKAKLKSLVLGSPTQGRAVQYSEVPVGQDKLLRFADAEVVLEGGKSLFRQGVQPDFPAPLELEVKHQVFVASQRSGMKPHVFDAERPRLNEAALVAKANPELDYQIAKSAERPTAWDEPPLKDRVVQQALDFLTTTQFLQPAAEPPPKK